MIALYIIGGLLVLIALLLSSPVSVRFYYRDTPELILRVWGCPFRLLPRPPEETHPEKTSISSDPKPKEQKPSLLDELQASFREDGVGAVLRWMEQLAGILKRAVGRLLKAVTVKNLCLQMRISGEDAAAAATNYGKVCAVFYPLLGAVSAGIRVNKRAVDLRPDFMLEGAAVLVDVTVGVSLWRLAGAAVAAGFSLLRIYMKMDDYTDVKERTVNDNG